MRPLVFATLLMTATTACSGPRPAETKGAPAPTPARLRTDGTEGAVCAWGHYRDRQAGVTPTPCESPLRCCYPCGVDGCFSVCETAEACSADQKP